MAAKGSEGPKLNKMPTLGYCGSYSIQDFCTKFGTGKLGQNVKLQQKFRPWVIAASGSKWLPKLVQPELWGPKWSTKNVRRSKIFAYLDVS